MNDERPLSDGRGARVRGRRRAGRIPLVRFALASLLVIIWAVAYLKATFDPKFHPPQEITTMALLAAGYLFGSGLLRAKDDPEENS